MHLLIILYNWTSILFLCVSGFYLLSDTKNRFSIFHQDTFRKSTGDYWVEILGLHATNHGVDTSRVICTFADQILASNQAG